MSGLPSALESSLSGSSGEHALRTYGRYEILGEIARGGMGIVYLARLSGEGGFSRLVGLKVMHPHLADQDGFARLMMREAKLAASIHHPNVVGTVDFGTHEGSYFMVLDYIEGTSLGHAVKAQPNAPPRLFLPCVIDALNGLQAAHGVVDYNGVPSPIVHQDVSPDNILVGIDGIARITDFGIAREVQQTTYAGNPKGKAAYMSPEQLTGRRVDERADLWSMGVVLWNLLTGEKLFHASTAAATIYNVLHAEIPLPSKTGVKPPPELDAVVMRALSRDQDERYASADEMAQALEEVGKKLGAIAPRAEVGKWIQASRPDELKRRREMVRRAGAAPAGGESLTPSGPLGRAIARMTSAASQPSGVTIALDDAALMTPGGTGSAPLGGVPIAPAKKGISRTSAIVLVLGVVGLAAWLALRQSEPAPSSSAAASDNSHAPVVTAPAPTLPSTSSPPVIEQPSVVAAPEQPPSEVELVVDKPLSPPPSAVSAPARNHLRARPSRAAQPPTNANTTVAAPAKPAVEMEANPYLRQE